MCLIVECTTYLSQVCRTNESLKGNLPYLGISPISIEQHLIHQIIFHPINETGGRVLIVIDVHKAAESRATKISSEHSVTRNSTLGSQRRKYYITHYRRRGRGEGREERREKERGGERREERREKERGGEAGGRGERRGERRRGERELILCIACTHLSMLLPSIGKQVFRSIPNLNPERQWHSNPPGMVVQMWLQPPFSIEQPSTNTSHEHIT